MLSCWTPKKTASVCAYVRGNKKNMKGRTRGLQGSIASEEHEPMRILWDLFTVGQQLEGVFVKIVALIFKIYIYIYIKILFFYFKKNLI